MKTTLDSLFIGKKWSDAYDCGCGAELNCNILIIERAIKENWDLFKLRNYLEERRLKLEKENLINKIKQY